MAPPYLPPGKGIYLTRGEFQQTSLILPENFGDKEANGISLADPATLDASEFRDPAVCGSTVDDLEFRWLVVYPLVTPLGGDVYAVKGITGYGKPVLQLAPNSMVSQIQPPVEFRVVVFSKATGLHSGSNNIKVLSEISESALTLTVYNSCKGQTVACPTCVCKLDAALPPTEPYYH